MRGEGLHALVLDLDHFKAINDRHGHATGDTVLVAFAQVLQALTAADMLTVRMGGEEFAVLIPDADTRGSDNRATQLGDAIRDALKPFAARGLPELTVSGGIARYQAGETLDGLIARADQLAYRAKRPVATGFCRIFPIWLPSLTSPTGWICGGLRRVDRSGEAVVRIVCDQHRIGPGQRDQGQAMFAGMIDRQAGRRGYPTNRPTPATSALSTIS